MIIGLGNDLIDIRRIESRKRSSGSAIASSSASSPMSSARNPTSAPSAPPPTPSASRPRRPAPRRSARGLNRGVFWRDNGGVVNLPGGKPTMQLTGGALKRLEAITPPGLTPSIELTITDDFPAGSSDRHHPGPLNGGLRRLSKSGVSP